MRRYLVMILSLALCVSLCAPNILAETTSSVQTPNANDTPAYAEGEVIVTMTDSADPQLSTPGIYSSDLDIEVENSWDFDDVSVSEVSSETLSTEELIDNLSDEKHVISVEPNYYRKKMSTNDSYRPYQWYLNDNSRFQQTSKGVQEEKIPSTLDSSGAIVAVVDTGVDYTHEDLKEHMWTNPYSSLKGTYGYDFADNDSDPMDEDDDGHGTHCAGIISAVRDNETGIAGISEARIMALKIFDKNGEAKDSYIIAAFNYIYQAQSLGANIVVVNCSWGGGGKTSESAKNMINKIGSNGSLFIFAAGNNGINHENTTSTATCPYDIDTNYVVKVGASDYYDNRAYFSDYGKTSVDLFAPGDVILSTVNKDTFVPFLYSSEQQKNLCSYYTSFDSPETTLYTAPEIGQTSNNMTYGQKEFSNNDFLGSDGSGSLSVSISTSQSKANCDLYIDVTNLRLNTRSTYYVSYDMGTEKNGAISWEHFISARNSMSFVRSGSRTYLRLVGISGDFRSLSRIYIDNAAISVAVTSGLAFGKYNVLSGTSMAAPAVSAAVALLATMYPNDTVTQRKNRLLNSTSASKDLSQLCISGGILDLSKLSSATHNPLPSATVTPTGSPQATATPTSETPKAEAKITVKKIVLNKKKATLRFGKKLKLKATITPKNATNKKVKWSVSNKKYATVTQKGVVKAKKKGIAHSVKIYAKAKDGSGKKAVCTIKIKRKR